MLTRTGLCVVIIVIAMMPLALRAGSDGDGVPDAVDVCCNTPLGISVDATGRPLGDLDEDCDVDLDDYALFAANLTGPLGPCGSPNGTACMMDGDCTSGFCRDGYCCGSNCMTSCRSCGLAGLEGVCSYIPAGTDPEGECPVGAACNGVGACVLPNGSACAMSNECDSGFCRDGYCCNTSCMGTCRTCAWPSALGICIDVPPGTDPDNECPSAAYCDGAGACASPNGSVCFSPIECDSGFCVDDRCCDSTCGGTCESCDVSGSYGTCTFIPDGSDPDDECSFPYTDCDGTGDCQ